jgi:hypothetical protein
MDDKFSASPKRDIHYNAVNTPYSPKPKVKPRNRFLVVAESVLITVSLIITSVCLVAGFNLLVVSAESAIGELAIKAILVVMCVVIVFALVYSAHKEEE